MGTGVVGELTLAQVQDLDCGAWFDASFAGQRVPTIAEIFALVAASLRTDPRRSQVILACDIKSKDPTGSLERDLVQLAIAHGVLDQLLFIGRYFPLHCCANTTSDLGCSLFFVRARMFSVHKNTTLGACLRTTRDVCAGPLASLQYAAT